MTLSEQAAKLYYKLWFPLLDYVNQKCRVNSKLKNIAGAKSLNPEEVKEIANVLWDNVSLIDSYLQECGDNLSEEYKDIVAGWKRRVCGQFIMERHLKKGSIFISMEDETVYQVHGIIWSWEEMFQFAPMPLMIEATFMPFRDVIISDGLVMPYNILIGSNMKRELKIIYLNAKKNGTLIKAL